MADVSKIVNTARFVKKLQRHRKEMEKQNAKYVIVGFTAAYALSVHENVEMKWQGRPRDHSLWQHGTRLREKATGRFAKVGKRGRYWDPQGQAQAKFLEEPARRMRSEIQRIIKEVWSRTRGDLQKALVAGGLRLIRESIQLVPVDTGNLKNSWFVRLEGKTGGKKTVSKGRSSKG